MQGNEGFKKDFRRKKVKCEKSLEKFSPLNFFNLESIERVLRGSNMTNKKIKTRISVLFGTSDNPWFHARYSPDGIQLRDQKYEMF